MTTINRYLKEAVLEDLDSKIIMVSGPRQAGKTTFSKFLKPSYTYLNYDLAEHRKLLQEKAWAHQTSLVIFDEIHKMNEWKRFLKGIYDTKTNNQAMLVTGSAKLDMFRKTGDSLAGRYFSFRLHPFDIKELNKVGLLAKNPQETIEQLLTVSGFPEPFLNGKQQFYQRWRKTYLDVILRQDLLDLTAIKNISVMETLIEMLRYRVGSPVSALSLAQDLQISPQTVQQWLSVLEGLYVIFKISPYHKNIARSLLKESKYYFYDTAYVLGNSGIKYENLIANSLQKEIQRIEDITGKSTNLFYLRNRAGNKIDFCIQIEDQPFILIEVKEKDDNLSSNLVYFSQYFQNPQLIQLVRYLEYPKEYPNGAKIVSATEWLIEF